MFISRLIKGRKCSCRLRKKNEVKMSSMIVMWKAIKQKQEQERAISQSKLEARKLSGGCVLISFPQKRRDC